MNTNLSVPTHSRIAVTNHVQYARHIRNVADFYLPVDYADAPICVLLHGGDWAKGDHTDLTLLALKLAENGIAVANVGQRKLADCAKPEELIQDVSDALTAMREHCSVEAAEPQHAFIFGHNNSGKLATALCHDQEISESIQLDGALAFIDEAYQNSDFLKTEAAQKLCMINEGQKSVRLHEEWINKENDERILLHDAQRLAQRISRWLLAQSQTNDKKEQDLLIGDPAIIRRFKSEDLAVATQTEN